MHNRTSDSAKPWRRLPGLAALCVVTVACTGSIAFDPEEVVGPTHQRGGALPNARNAGTAADTRSGSAAVMIVPERTNAEQAEHDLRSPTLFRSNGAWLSLLAALIAATLGMLRLRDWVRGQFERLRIEERRRERAHVARMLHDTLLQGTQGFIFLAQAAANRMCSDDPAKALLERALLRADATLLEGRIRLLDLRDSEHTGADLSLLLTSVGKDLAAEHPERFRFKVDGVARPMRPCAADAAFLIGREALVNAFRHAGAKAVELRIHHADRHLAVCISDDGCGIEPDILAQGGLPGRWGLRGMRERAAMIPAHLQMRRLGDHGTEVELRIDARTAYGPQLRPRWHMPGWAGLHAWQWPVFERQQQQSGSMTAAACLPAGAIAGTDCAPCERSNSADVIRLRSAEMS